MGKNLGLRNEGKKTGVEKTGEGETGGKRQEGNGRGTGRAHIRTELNF